MSRVGIIGDLHEPVSHPGYLAFCKDLFNKYKCNTIMFIGDVADNQAITFHIRNPMCPGSQDEYLLAKQKIRKWYKVFPEARVCIGNHDDRVKRLAEAQAIPETHLLTYNQAWGTIGWDWKYDHIIDGVYYFHGTMNGGLHPAWIAAGKMLMSVVLGHNHSRSGVQWRANPRTRIFGMDVGCGIDVDAYQFAYGKHIKERPILSAAVVVDGIPYHHVMPCGVKERYHKSRFRR